MATCNDLQSILAADFHGELLSVRMKLVLEPTVVAFENNCLFLADYGSRCEPQSNPAPKQSFGKCVK